MRYRSDGCGVYSGERVIHFVDKKSLGIRPISGDVKREILSGPASELHRQGAQCRLVLSRQRRMLLELMDHHVVNAGHWLVLAFCHERSNIAVSLCQMIKPPGG